MNGPMGAPPESEDRPLQDALRWLISVCVALVLTFGLLTTMTRLIDGSWILKGLIRIYPLTTAEACPDGNCEEALPELPTAVTIEGTVGYLAEGRVVPLAAAQIVAERPNGKRREVEVDSSGQFRFVTSWPSDASTSQDDPSRRRDATSTQLQIRAPGCSERRVPVTRAWTPRPILLSCSEDG